MRPSCGHFYKLHSSEVGIWIIATNGSLPPDLIRGEGAHPSCTGLSVK